MAIDLYYALMSPPARAVAILAKHLGLDVNIKELNLLAGETRTPEYLKLNPGHTVPTLVDDGFVLFESRAILQYLANKYASDKSLYPEEAQARANVDKLLFFDASSLFPAVKNVWLPKIKDNAEPPQEALDNLGEKVKILETLLGDQQFFAGDKATIADISFGVILSFLEKMNPEWYPSKFQAWYERLTKAVPELLEYNNKAADLYKEIMEKKQ
ncbi:hypothetical protein RDWZM_005543 [Blomia tropicalis]|uniref:Uncharacterized protein n=1 Tax=Blomia tropicalis TaxID=40697 RepID=A0A9Q0RNJ5_BLOTA|nr:hypothetical protein RDWZM_005543 [Blomia tropicalis]